MSTLVPHEMTTGILGTAGGTITGTLHVVGGITCEGDVTAFQPPANMNEFMELYPHLASYAGSDGGVFQMLDSMAKRIAELEAQL